MAADSKTSRSLRRHSGAASLIITLFVLCFICFVFFVYLVASINKLELELDVSLLVAQNKKAHTIAVSLVLPAAKILVRNLTGEKDAAKLDSVSLSNDAVRRRIKEMSDDISNQVIVGIGA